MKEKIFDKILEIIPLNNIFLTAFGVNNFLIKMSGYKKGTFIHLNKQRSYSKIVSEFLFRILILDACLYYFIVNICYSFFNGIVLKLFHGLEVPYFNRMCLIILLIIFSFSFSDFFISSVFYKRLEEIGFHRLAKNNYANSLYLFHILYSLCIFFHIISGFLYSWILFGFVFVGMLFYLIVFFHINTKQDIYSFRLSSTNHDTGIDPETGIWIELKNGNIVSINLLKEKLFIEDTDDILVTAANNQKQQILKDDIFCIHIGDINLQYFNGQWNKSIQL